ncbi:hypothetical protein HMI54_002594 [Coelomomyces lativittatus]|nr:hypothetical protein HMI54_002594 [Coelomomyces lativittatus]KAJ1518162.1 hypothetical protein HMI55_002237 [Coelomomyces lativittatus]
MDKDVEKRASISKAAGSNGSKHAKKAINAVGKQGRECFTSFKTFISRDNIIDSAIGISLALAYTAIINSVVNDIFSPLIAKASPKGVSLSELHTILTRGKSNVDWYPNRDAAKTDGAVTLNWGNTIQTTIQFFIIAIFLFLFSQIIFRIIKKPPPPPTRECPFCFEKIPEKASRCKFCTSMIHENMLSEPDIGMRFEKSHSE